MYSLVAYISLWYRLYIFVAGGHVHGPGHCFGEQRLQMYKTPTDVRRPNI